MFYIQQDEKIVLFDTDKEKLQNTLAFMPQYEDLKVLETEKNIVVFDGVFYFEDDEEYIAKKQRAEQERIAMLNLTAADVERGIYKARGMDFEDIINFILTYPQDGLDLKALRIELKANHFYRGNVYVNVIGNILGFTAEQLDKFFEDGNYEHLLNGSLTNEQL